MNWKTILITVAITLVAIKLLNSFAPTLLASYDADGNYEGEEYA